MMSHFSLAFKIHFVFVFQQLTVIFWGVDLLEFILLGVVWPSVCRLSFFIMFGLFGALFSSNVLFLHFSLPSLLGLPLCIHGILTLLYCTLRLCSVFCFSSFSLFLRLGNLNWPSSGLLILLSASSNLPVRLLRIFFSHDIFQIHNFWLVLCMISLFNDTLYLMTYHSHTLFNPLDIVSFNSLNKSIIIDLL